MYDCIHPVLFICANVLCKGCFSQNLPKGEIVRFVDCNWPYFVKTSVLARCLDMLVRHHSVPCLAFLEICFKREISEDSMKI
jgi:hypothetical protein